MAKQTLTITIDDFLLAELDKYLKEKRIVNRSKFISDLIRMALKFLKQMG